MDNRVHPLWNDFDKWVFSMGEHTTEYWKTELVFEAFIQGAKVGSIKTMERVIETQQQILENMKGFS